MDFASFYDEQHDYAEFRNDPEKREEYSVIVDWKVKNLVSLLPEGFKPENVMEVGCAFGVLLNKVGDRLNVKNRTGVDIAANNIEVARKLYPACNFFRGTIEEFMTTIPDDIPNQRYDLVVLSDIVEHVPDDEGFLRLVSQVGTYVILNLPLEKSFTTRNRQYGEQDPSGHLRSYDVKDAEELVGKAGFRVEKSFTDIAFFDRSYRKVYSKKRRKRLVKKPLPKKLFWTIFYFGEDRIKLVSRKLTARISGENYFALLRKNST
jgi:SAM-dependent methyltransferase